MTKVPCFEAKAEIDPAFVPLRVYHGKTQVLSVYQYADSHDF